VRYIRLVRALVLLVIALTASATTAAADERLPREFTFTASKDAQVTLTIRASCARCDWSVRGREAIALKLDLDGVYSQHVLLTRGSKPADYVVFLGPLAEGPHTVRIARDTALSAKDAGEVEIDSLGAESTDVGSPYYARLANAPILHARPGTVERFSDVPLAAYAEYLPVDRSEDRGFRYTIVFSHEDGGTPTDRLMATWGRSTDIEFIYEFERLPEGRLRQEYQGPKHQILPFRGKRIGDHPLLWISTDNNMVTDTGPADAVRFALAPAPIGLSDVSREAFMDANPWLYEVMRAELIREGRLDPAAAAGSGKIPDPLRFAYVEACGELQDATLAFDVAVAAERHLAWHATDRGDMRFRIGRSGCFRAAVPLPVGTVPSQIRGIRARAYTRPPREGETPLPPGSGRAALRRVNTVFMLSEEFTPVATGIRWYGQLHLSADGSPAEIRIDKSRP
jgi:hypothetical protein